MKAVDIINKNTALEFAAQVISKGCTITTAGYTVYPQLKSQGYTHERILSSEPEAEEKFRWVHTLISNAKSFIAGGCNRQVKMINNFGHLVIAKNGLPML